MKGRRLRAWQRACAWWAQVDITIGLATEHTGRKRSFSLFWEVPRWAWRPYCWAVGNHWRRKRARRSENYGACVYCGAVPRRWAEWSDYTRMRLARREHGGTR